MTMISRVNSLLHETQSCILLSNSMPTVIFFRDQCCIFWAALFSLMLHFFDGMTSFSERNNTLRRNDKQRRGKSKLPVCITRLEFISQDFWHKLMLLSFWWQNSPYSYLVFWRERERDSFASLPTLFVVSFVSWILILTLNCFPHPLLFLLFLMYIK